MQSRKRLWSVLLVLALAAAGVVGFVLVTREPAPVTVWVGSDAVPAPSESPVAAEPVLTPEDRARQDLDKLVRDYYAAENAAYLDPATDPTAALDPYLRNPASGARVADILTFRRNKHQLDARSAEVHAVAVTELQLASEPPTAVIEECHTLAASGIDGETGQPASFSNRRRTVWTAVALADGSWRLKTYETGEVGSC